MTSAGFVGAVYVDVRPSTDEFVNKMDRDLTRQMDALGEKLGEQFGRTIGRDISDSVGQGIDQGLRNAGRNAGRSGRDAGGAFARQFRATVESALRNLPDIDIKVAAKGSVNAAVQAARAALSSLNDRTIGIDLPVADALAKIQSIRTALLALRDQTVTVNMRSDIDGALKDLDRAERDLADRGESVAGAFADSYRNTLRRALGDLPTIDQDIAVSLDQEELFGLRRQIEAALGRTDVELNLDPDGAIADVARLRAALETLRGQTLDLKVRDEIDQALKPLRAYEERIAGLATESERARDALADLDRVRRDAAERGFPGLRDALPDPGQETAAADQLNELVRAFNALRDVEIGANFSDTEALAGVARFRAAVLALQDLDVSVELKAAATQALAEFAKIETAAAKIEAREPEIKIQANLGAFETEVRAAIAAATKAIPEIPIDGDPTQFNAELNFLRARLIALSNQRITPEFTSGDFLAELSTIQAALTAIGTQDVEIDVKTNAEQAEAAIERVTRNRATEVRIEPNLGSFETKARAAIAKATKAIPEIKIDGDTTQIDRDLDALRVRLLALQNKTIGIDLNADAFLAEMRAIQAALATVRDKKVRVDVSTNAADAAKALGAVGPAAEKAGNQGHASFNRMRLIIAALIVLFPVLAAAIVALPALLSLVVIAAAAVAAGADGIKAAFQPLGPLMNDLKSQVSATFEQGLAPAVENIATLFPTLTAGLVGTASALSDVTTQVTAVYASGQNLPVLANSFTRLNGVISGLGPSLVLLNQNLIDLVNIGAQGLIGLGAQMTGVGEKWANVIAVFQNTGVGAQAVDALVQILGALLGLLAPLTQLGAELAAALGPSLAGAINFLAGAIGLLADLLSVLGQVFGPVGELATTFLAAITTLALVMRVFGATIPVATFSMAGFGSAMLGAAVAARGFAIALAGLLLNPIVLAVGAIAVAFSVFSNNAADASAASAEYESHVSGLADSLRSTGGVVTSSTREFVQQSEAFQKVKDGALDAGVGLTTLTDAATGNQAALDQTRAKLQAVVDANKTFNIGLYDLGNGLEFTTYGLNDVGVAAQKDLNAINDLAQGFADAQARAAELAVDLRETGVSLVGGVANAEALSGAFDVLKDAMSTTAEKAEALATALTLLVGGSLSVEQANAELGNTIADIGVAFEEARVAAETAGVGILDASGKINQATQEGRDLVLAFADVTPAMAEAATSAFDAAGGIGNLAASVPAATTSVQGARDAFIEFATNAGLSAEAANNYADQMGLIPELVVTLLKAEGVPLAVQELLQLSSQLDAVEPGVSIPVKALTAEAIGVLRELKVNVDTLPDGTLTVTATDETPPVISDILASILGTPPAAIPTTLDPAGVAQALPTAQGIVENAPPAGLPTTVDDTGVTLGLNGLGELVATAPPGQLPVETNNAAVPSGAAAAAGVVAGVDAQLPITPNYVGLSLSLTAIRNQISRPIEMPITVNLVSASLAITAIQNQARTPVVLAITADTTAANNAIAGLTVARTVTITVTADTGAAAGAINTLAVARATTITVTADTGAAAGALNTLAVARSTTVTAVANTAAAVGALNTMAVNRTSTLTVIYTSVGAAQSAYNALAQPKTAAFTLTYPSISIAQLAYNNLAQPKGAVFTLTYPFIGLAQTAYNNLAVNKSAVFTVTSNLAAVQREYDNLARNRTSTLTVNIRQNGAVPTVPNAMGNILPANLRAFARGGMMPAGKASIVKPNTFRLIGDRSKDDEAYIPINNSPRSQSLLETTAARMGRVLLPMAMGGVLGNGAAQALTRLATTLDKQRVSTQPTGAFAATVSGGGDAAVSDTRGLAERLDRIATLLAQRPNDGAITVEDRSGNPVETARRVQLALRTR